MQSKAEKDKGRFKALPFWKRAERVIAQQLRLKGVPCKLIAGQNLGWDIVSRNGLKIECKAARLLRQRRKRNLVRAPFWVVGIARSHRLREDGVDFYVVRLLGDDLRKIYLVLLAPLCEKQLQITFRQLLTKYRDNINRWDLIQDAEKRRARAI